MKAHTHTHTHTRTHSHTPATVHTQTETESFSVIYPSPVASSTEFGQAVSVDGNIMAVGALSYAGHGTVFMYTRANASSVWNATQMLTASDARA